MNARSGPVTVVLLGNPNTGKSTLFSALVGMRQRTGNYPGVTVEKKVGTMSIGERTFQFIDLPGTYSLAPHSPDEMLAVDVLLGRRTDVPPPDVIVSIVDASNLPRNLYLVSQLMELGRPMVVALNMTDVAQARGIQLDVARLQQNLGVPVVPIQAHRKEGLEQLKEAIAQAAQQGAAPRTSPLPAAVSAHIDRLHAKSQQQGNSLPRYLIERRLLDTGYLASARLPQIDYVLRDAIEQAQRELTAGGQSLAALETTARYRWVGQVLDNVIERRAVNQTSWSDRFDAVLTHRFWGSLIFAVLMLIVFQSVFSWASWAMDGIESIMDWTGIWVSTYLSAGPLQSMLVNGVIGGVGGVLVFLPQIFILFFFIALMEDCGYMARAAYLMDKLMARVGLSGKSFIPLLSSFACAIPGIMATRVIENRRDRLVTILIAPLMSCSARLPVYTLMIGAFIPQRKLFGGLQLQSLTLAAMYLIGTLTAVAVAWLLKKTILPGETPPFVLELPSYKIPSARVVLLRMLERGWSFVRRAGTLILAVTILVWAAGYFPHRPQDVAPLQQQRQTLSEQLVSAHEAGSPERTEQLLSQLARLDNQIAGTYVRRSYLGRAGQWIEPAVRPLGWDWRIGCAVIASFPAREVVVGTLGVIYNLGEEGGEQGTALAETLRTATWDNSDRPVFTIPVALSIMVFFALCAQCFSTLVVMRRETNSWRWPVFSFTYMTLLAYLGAMLTFQVGTHLF